MSDEHEPTWAMDLPDWAECAWRFASCDKPTCAFCDRPAGGDELPGVEWAMIEVGNQEGMACSFCQFPVEASEHIGSRNKARLANGENNQ